MKNATKKVKHPDGRTELWPEEIPDEVIKAAEKVSKGLKISKESEYCPTCGCRHGDA